MLELEKLQLTNLGVILNKDISFSSGINIIQAPTGSGKSSIVQALLISLLDDYEGSYDDYVNENKDFFSIKNDFSIDTVPYTLSFKNEKGKSTRELFNRKDNMIVATGEEVKRYLSQLLDPDIGKFALVAKQKSNIDNIVTCKDSERRDLFKKIKNIEYDKYVKEEIEAQLEVINKTLSEVEKEIYRLDNTTYEYKEKKDLPFSEETYESLLKEKAHLLVLQNNYTLRKQQYEKVSLEVHRLTAQEETFYNEKGLLQKQIEDINITLEALKIDNGKTAKESIQKEIQENENIQKEYSLQQENALSFIDTIYDAQIETLQTEKNGYIVKEKEIKIVKMPKYDDTKLKELHTQETKTNVAIETAQKNIKSFEKGICPTCGADCSHTLGMEQEKLDSLQLALKEILNQIVKELHEKEKYEEQIEGMQQQKNEKERLITSIEKTNREIEIAQNAKEREIETSQKLFEEKIFSITSLIAEKQKMLLRIEEQHQQKIISFADKKNTFSLILETKEKEIKECSQRKQEQEKELVSIDLTDSFEEGVLHTLEAQIQSYEHIGQENKIIEENNQILQLREKEDKELLQKQNEKKQNLLKDKYNNEQARVILLKDFPNFVIDSSITTIEDNMNQFIENVYSKSLNVALRATKTAIKLEYGKGKNTLPAHRLSGGESKLVSLAFIHNFNNLIGLNCLILDEPDAPFDDKMKKDMYEVLLNLQSIYNQIIIITHSEKMLNYLTANASPNVITI